jgi:putative ABC transport system permease protein
VLVSEGFLANSGLALGDQINMRIELAYTVNFESVFTIVGAYRHFPTIGEGTEAMIGNLDYLFNYLGVPFGHDIWLKLDKGASGNKVMDSVKLLHIDAIRRQDTRAQLTEEQSRLEQVGVLGTLSIGLLAAAWMAILGLLIYGYASIRERSYRFGVLRALGLSRWQAIGQVAAEYALLTIYGAGAGAAVGAVASKLFMPFFGTIGRGPSPLPPLLPVLVGSEIALVAAGFAILTVLLQLAVVAVSVRKRLFQLMRMGH